MRTLFDIEREVDTFSHDKLADVFPRTTEISVLREIAKQTFRNGLLLEEAVGRLIELTGRKAPDSTFITTHKGNYDNKGEK